MVTNEDDDFAVMNRTRVSGEKKAAACLKLMYQIFWGRLMKTTKNVKQIVSDLIRVYSFCEIMEL